jgi:flagellar L-ring protein precursor FlgH
MLRYIAIALLLFAPLAAKDKKKKSTAQKSPLDQYLGQTYATSKGSVQPTSPGSMWSPDSRFLGLAMDLRANRVGDVVTILVAENASAVASGDVKTARQSTLSSSISALGGPTKATGALANLAGVNTQSGLQGQGATTRQTTITATVSAHVTQVLPNGTLVIEGVKHVQVNSEDQTILVRGIIRPVDVLVDNTVPSDRLSEMEVRVNGKGVVADSIRRPFILWRLLMGILPF